MIAKGNTHCDGVKLADYLLRGDPGERAELLDMRGFATGDLHQAFADIELMKEATRADAALFHVQIRGADGEGKKLTREQWLEIADGCDLALGREMTQQGRAASLHIDEQTGDMHMHLAYDLIRQADDGRLFVQKLGLYETKLQLYAREIEQKYGLQILSNERNPGARRADRNELEELRRLGTDIHEIRTAIMQGFHSSDNGRSFQAAMQEQGFEVAAGDRRNCFVVIDQEGGQHALNKKLTGMTLKEIEARLADLDRAQLPSVDQAKQMQHDRAAAREAHQAHERPQGMNGHAKDERPSQAPENERQAAIKPLGQTAGEVRTAWQITKGRSVEAFAEELENRGLILVHVSRQEAATSYRAREYAKEIKRQNRALKEGFAVVDARGNVTKIDQRVTGDHWAEIEKRLGALDKRELPTVDEAREMQREARRESFKAEKAAQREAERGFVRGGEILEPGDQLAARLGKTATEIRAAWQKAPDGERLTETFAAHGMTLARATADEAYQSERDAAFAKEIGSRSRGPVLNEGEIVAVNSFGNVYRLNERTTGSEQADIDKRLAAIPEAELLSVADTKQAMREASKAAWVEQQHIEREKERPATRLEQAIIAADREAGRDDAKFGVELEKAGIAIARVTAADVKALDALRAEQDVAQMTATADAAADMQRTRIFADVKENDLCVVTKWGDVLALNQQHIGQLENRNFPAPAPATSSSSTELVAGAGDDKSAKSAVTLPGVIEARAAFEIDSELLQGYWQEINRIRAADRQNATDRRVAMFESGQAIEQQQAILDSVQDAKQGIIAAGGAAVDSAVSVTGKALHSLEWVAEGIITGLGNLWASISKPTELEREIAPKVAEEKAQARADIDYHQLTEAVRDAVNEAHAKQQNERRAAPEYFRHIDREADHER